ncbi:MAG: GntR family transcriptional regulator [Lachnospiraceae bacterium]|nr:GntR family transcriptional regulator [Lachnospiraceae bacterium]
MLLKIDFNSDEAIYMQLRNQIIIGIATSEIQDGESLPSVRDLAETLGINMHTVNKSYSILKQEGYLKVDRRRGAVVSVSPDKMRATMEMMAEMKVAIAKGICRGVSREEALQMVDEIYRYYGEE